MYPVARIGAIYARPVHLIKSYVHKLPAGTVSPELVETLKGRTVVIGGVGYLTIPLLTLYHRYPHTISFKGMGEDKGFAKAVQLRELIGHLTIGLYDELISKAAMNVQALIVDLPDDPTLDKVRNALYAFDHALRTLKDPDKAMTAVTDTRAALLELPCQEGPVVQTLVDIREAMNDIELITYFMR